MFGAIAGGIASDIDGGAMSKLFGGGQKAASGGIQGDVLATDNNTVGMGDAGIKSAIQGSNVPNPDEAVPSFVFFSRRRRHKRFKCDWSSDVCSSDLLLNATSITIFGSTMRRKPWSSIVCSRNHFVISAISASVSPE